MVFKIALIIFLLAAGCVFLGLLTPFMSTLAGVAAFVAAIACAVEK